MLIIKITNRKRIYKKKRVIEHSTVKGRKRKIKASQLKKTSEVKVIYRPR
jgi:hypothetical protein